ncbi:hypothetical protein EG835_08055, partial [bacterium]|nr:hypothetical protein [bacterium]
MLGKAFAFSNGIVGIAGDAAWPVDQLGRPQPSPCGRPAPGGPPAPLSDASPRWRTIYGDVRNPRGGFPLATLPRVTVDLEKITENTRTVVEALGGRAVYGVTKVTCGAPEVGAAMLAGGAKGIADSRLENVEHMRNSGLLAEFWSLRAPVPDRADEVVRLIDVSLESEIETVRALDDAAARLGKTHRIIAMVDLGDLREGMLARELPAFLAATLEFGNIEVFGIGTSLTCFGSIVPDADNLGELVRLAEEAEAIVGRRLHVSGGMSS